MTGVKTQNNPLVAEVSSTYIVECATVVGSASVDPGDYPEDQFEGIVSWKLFST
jgi:hypothetical protein